MSAPPDAEHNAKAVYVGVSASHGPLVLSAILVLKRQGEEGCRINPKGVQNEPFVCPLNEIIDGICQRFGSPPVEGLLIMATFCDERAIDHVAEDALVKEDEGARLEFDATDIYSVRRDTRHIVTPRAGHRAYSVQCSSCIFPIGARPLRWRSCSCRRRLDHEQAKKLIR